MAYLYRLRTNRYSRIPNHQIHTNDGVHQTTAIDHAAAESDWDPQMPTEYRNEMFDQLHNTDHEPPIRGSIEHANLLENDSLNLGQNEAS